ncbi:MAG: hypothetical protein AAFQ22_03880 [Pseudomonadota bacterium]
MTESSGVSPDASASRSYEDDVPVTFRHQKTQKKSVLSLWLRISLVIAALAAGLIAVIALGPGIEFFEYWYLVAFASGILGLLLLWEFAAGFFTRQ